MDEKKRNEVLAFIWFAVSLLVLLSLLSYTPDDVAFEVSTPNSPTHNFVGPFGAYTGWALRMLFGKTAYFLIPVFLLWSLAKWAGKKAQALWLRIFSVAIFLTSACALFSIIASQNAADRFQAGGILGYFTSIFLSATFGHAGMLVALSLFLLSVILATELLILQIASGLFDRAKNRVVPAVLSKEAFSAKPVKAEGKLAALKQSIAQKIKPSLKKEEKLAPLVPEAKPQIKLSIPKPEAPKTKPMAPKPALISAESLAPGA